MIYFYSPRRKIQRNFTTAANAGPECVQKKTKTKLVQDKNET